MEARILFEEIQLMAGEAFSRRNLADGHAKITCSWRSARTYPCPTNSATFIQAVDALVEVAHECSSAELSIREDLEPKFLLLTKCRKDVLVFERFQLCKRS